MFLFYYGSLFTCRVKLPNS